MASGEIPDWALSAVVEGQFYRRSNDGAWRPMDPNAPLLADADLLAAQHCVFRRAWSVPDDHQEPSASGSAASGGTLDA